MISVAAIRMQQFGVQFYQASLTASDIDKLVRFEVLSYGDQSAGGVRGGKKAPSKIRWECSSDWPFWNGTTVDWTFEPSERGTEVVLRHLGYADDMPDFAFGSVSLTWAVVASRLKDVVESGEASNPALG